MSETKNEFKRIREVDTGNCDLQLISILTDGRNEHEVWDFLDNCQGLTDDLKVKIFNFLAPEYILNDDEQELVAAVYGIGEYPIKTATEIVELFGSFTEKQQRAALRALAEIDDCPPDLIFESVDWDDASEE